MANRTRRSAEEVEAAAVRRHEALIESAWYKAQDDPDHARGER
jgi:hypothetical protein